MSKARLGTFEDLVEMTNDPLKPIVKRLRQVILAIDPEATEVVRLGDRAATYGLGPKKMSEGYVYILPYTAWVNLGFYKGVELPDPDGILAGTGAKLRHIKIRTLDDAERPNVKNLIRAALEERKAALGR